MEGQAGSYGKSQGIDGNSASELIGKTHTPLALGWIGLDISFSVCLRAAACCVLRKLLWRGNCCQGQRISEFLGGSFQAFFPEASSLHPESKWPSGGHLYPASVFFFPYMLSFLPLSSFYPQLNDFLPWVPFVQCVKYDLSQKIL